MSSSSVSPTSSLDHSTCHDNDNDDDEQHVPSHGNFMLMDDNENDIDDDDFADLEQPTNFTTRKYDLAPASTTTSTPTSSDEEVSDEEEASSPCEYDEEEACHGQICLPATTVTSTNQSPTCPRHRRCVANQCTICLSPFDINQDISWSANSDCVHVFHNTCIASWLSAAGRQYVNRQQAMGGVHASAPQSVVQFPMLCPCCRQVFVPNDA